MGCSVPFDYGPSFPPQRCTRPGACFGGVLLPILLIYILCEGAGAGGASGAEFGLGMDSNLDGVVKLEGRRLPDVPPDVWVTPVRF